MPNQPVYELMYRQNLHRTVFDTTLYSDWKNIALKVSIVNRNEAEQYIDALDLLEAKVAIVYTDFDDSGSMFDVEDEVFYNGIGKHFFGHDKCFIPNEDIELFLRDDMEYTDSVLLRALVDFVEQFQIDVSTNVGLEGEELGKYLKDCMPINFSYVESGNYFILKIGKENNSPIPYIYKIEKSEIDIPSNAIKFN